MACPWIIRSTAMARAASTKSRRPPELAAAPGRSLGVDTVMSRSRQKQPGRHAADRRRSVAAVQGYPHDRSTTIRRRPDLGTGVLSERESRALTIPSNGIERRSQQSYSVLAWGRGPSTSEPPIPPSRDGTTRRARPRSSTSRVKPGEREQVATGGVSGDATDADAARRRAAIHHGTMSKDHGH